MTQITKPLWIGPCINLNSLLICLSNYVVEYVKSLLNQYVLLRPDVLFYSGVASISWYLYMNSHLDPEIKCSNMTAYKYVAITSYPL